MYRAGAPDNNQCLQHHLLDVRLQLKHHENQDLESKNMVTVARVELGNVKDALRVLKSRASVYKSALASAIEGQDYVRGESLTTSAELKREKGPLLQHLTSLSCTQVTCERSRLQCKKL